MTYYVYELIDPRDNEPFYVGKGKGNRMYAHECDARRGKPGPKCDRIRDILGSGHSVKANILKYFEDEVAAYAHEKHVIKSYGFDTLTNLNGGGGGLRPESPKEGTPAHWRMVVRMVARFIRYSRNFSQPLVIRLAGERIELGNKFTDAINALKTKTFQQYGFDKAHAEYMKWGVNFIPPMLPENNGENNGV